MLGVAAALSFKRVSRREEILMADAIAGGWTGWKFDIDPEAKKVFDEALKHLVGVHYTPIAVATQVVAGLNYSFLSKGKVVHPEAADNLVVKIHIFKPLPTAHSAEPYITEIVRVVPQN
jgi:hypothetical protein